MNKNKEPLPSDDPLHDGDTYIGPDVPKSVFFKGLRRDRCVSFKRTSELAAEQEAADRRESQRLKRERDKRANDKYRGNPPR
jgi:hypothetical protein